MKSDFTITSEEDLKLNVTDSYDTGKSIAFDCIPKEDWEKASKDFSQGNEKLESLLKVMWKNGIATWGCSSEKGIEYLSFFIDNLADDEVLRLVNGFCSRQKLTDCIISRNEQITGDKFRTRLSLYCSSSKPDEFFNNIEDAVLDMRLSSAINLDKIDSDVVDFCKDVNFIKNLESNVFAVNTSEEDLEKCVLLNGFSYKRLKTDKEVKHRESLNITSNYFKHDKELKWHSIVDDEGEFYDVLDEHSVKLNNGDYVTIVDNSIKNITENDLKNYPIFNYVNEFDELKKSYKLGELDKIYTELENKYSFENTNINSVSNKNL